MLFKDDFNLVVLSRGDTSVQLTKLELEVLQRLIVDENLRLDPMLTDSQEKALQKIKVLLEV